jgi:predicted nucleic acid-binding protein
MYRRLVFCCPKIAKPNVSQCSA